MDLELEELTQRPAFKEQLQSTYYTIMANIQNLIMFRWILFIIVTLLFTFRLIETEKFLFVFALWLIQIVKNTVDFLTPIMVSNNGKMELPELDEEEFKPYNRMLPEIEYWKYNMVTSTLCMVATFFKVFDFPVYPMFIMAYILVAIGLVIFEHAEHVRKFGYSLMPGLKKKVYE
eukprot:GAHX01000746.1.p1 GENE.GAHX01000746.1~~GAHX01000746.1.p1  ORF type:complete len:175 (-),score=24.26 GAHX01000746.1:33-557(-)